MLRRAHAEFPMPIFTHLYVNGALIGESIQVSGWGANDKF